MASTIEAVGRHNGWSRRVAAAAGAVVFCAASVVLAQPEERIVEVQPAQRAGPEPVLILERAALADLIVDERDAGLARALSMFPARLRELTREAPQLDQLPEPVMRLLMTFANQPARVAIAYNRFDQAGGAFGLGVIISMLTEDQQQAEAVHGTVSGLIAARRLPFETRPSRGFAGMSEVFSPFGLARWGPRQVGGAWRYEVHFGSVGGEPDRVFEALPEPRVGDGFRPVIRAALDPAPLTPFLDMAAAFTAGQPEAEAGLQRLMQSGLVGPDAVRYSFQFGYLPDRSVSEFRMIGARAVADRLMLPTEPLTEADLRLIPVDATVASVARFNIGAIIGAVRAMAEESPEVAEGLAEFQRHTGVDPVNELLASLGGTAAGYLSDSSGGAGLGSAVFVATLADVEMFRQANRKFLTLLNVQLAEAGEVEGRVRGREWAQEGVTLYSLTFPGLPIPLEPTYAVTDRVVVFGLTPQAVLAGVRQSRGDLPGLLQHEGVRASLPRGGQFTNITFVDTARTMRGGYQYVSLAGSALANAMRSPVDPARDPGIIVPPFGELARDVRPRVSFGYWDGDALVYRTYGNRSLLVDAAGLIGAAEPVFPLIGAAAVGGMAQQQQQQRMGPPRRRGR